MDPTTFALTSARARIAFGAAALAVPGALVKGMAGTATPGSAESVFTRMWGARDLALGIGMVVAIDHGTPVRGWLEAAATADAGDALAALLGRRRLSRNGYLGTVVLASSSVALNLFLARRLDPPPAAHPHQPEAVVTGHHEP